MAYCKVEKLIGKRILSIETGKIAKQADGAALVRYGDTMVLATAVSAPEEKEEADFFPLTVDYREKTYAAGKFPGGFFKREGRPTLKEILTMRLIDRPLRPLFPETYLREVQIMSMVLSADRENDPDILHDRRFHSFIFVEHSFLRTYRFCKSWSDRWRICYQPHPF